LVNRRNRDLSQEDISLIADNYHNWKHTTDKYQDVQGFCKSVSVDEIEKLNFVITPGRYVGLADEEDDFNFVERFTSLKGELEQQMAEEQDLNRRIIENLNKIKLT
jgi:type I restriction enzyme M protein